MLAHLIPASSSFHFGTSSLADGLRWINLGLAAWLTAKAVNIVFFYARIRNRARSKPLVWHIILIGTSYMLLLAFAAADSVLRLDKEFSWRIVTKFIASVLAIVSFRMMNMHLRYERKTADYVESVNTSCPYCGSGFVARYCASCGKEQPEWKD